MKRDQEQESNEIKELKRLSRKTRDPRMKTRYDAVRLSLQGRSKSEIAGILGVTYQTVRNYINAYNESGVECLAIDKPTGRTRKLTDEQEGLLYECISSKLPKDVGFEPFVNWSAPLARQWVMKEFGVSFSERGIRDVFYRLKLSYTRPTYTLAKADPEKQEEFIREFENLKKTDFRGYRCHIV